MSVTTVKFNIFVSGAKERVYPVAHAEERETGDVLRSEANYHLTVIQVSAVDLCFHKIGAPGGYRPHMPAEPTTGFEPVLYTFQALEQNTMVV